MTGPNTTKFYKKKARKKTIEVIGQETGKKFKMKIRAVKPQKCSVAWRICIRCQKERIHKNSSFYEGKVCKECFTP